MNTALVLISGGSALIAIGLLIREQRRVARFQRQLSERLNADVELIDALTARLRDKTSRPYWSCRSTAEARGITAGLIVKARKAVKAARENKRRYPEMADELERQAWSYLGAADLLLDYIDAQVVPLIGRVRREVEILHGEAACLRAQLSDWFGRSGQAGRELDDAARRVAMLENALQAYRSSIAGTPVTVLKSLNTQFGVMNEALGRIISDTGQDQDDGKIS